MRTWWTPDRARTHTYIHRYIWAASLDSQLPFLIIHLLHTASAIQLCTVGVQPTDVKMYLWVCFYVCACVGCWGCQSSLQNPQRYTVLSTQAPEKINIGSLPHSAALAAPVRNWTIYLRILLSRTCRDKHCRICWKRKEMCLYCASKCEFELALVFPEVGKKPS